MSFLGNAMKNIQACTVNFYTGTNKIRDQDILGLEHKLRRLQACGPCMHSEMKNYIREDKEAN